MEYEGIYLKDEEKACPCGAMGKDLEFYRFTQYRPKEFLVKCSKCERQVGGKGNHLHVMERKWFKTFGKQLGL